MHQHRMWIALAFCWLFLFFNIERIYEPIDIASFVYVLATLAGILMLASRTAREFHPSYTGAAFLLMHLVGKCLLGYTVSLQTLPIMLCEAGSILLTQYLFLKIARHTDEFSGTTSQLLQILRGRAVPNFEQAEPHVLEEIRRARRHQRPITFVSMRPGSYSTQPLEELVRRVEQMIGYEYVMGCLGERLLGNTKSHDIITRVGDKFLLLLPETNRKQAEAMASRLAQQIFNDLNIPMESEVIAFGDELTLNGVLERMARTAKPSVVEQAHNMVDQSDSPFPPNHDFTDTEDWIDRWKKSEASIANMKG